MLLLAQAIAPNIQSGMNSWVVVRIPHPSSCLVFYSIESVEIAERLFRDRVFHHLISYIFSSVPDPLLISFILERIKT